MQSLVSASSARKCPCKVREDGKSYFQSVHDQKNKAPVMCLKDKNHSWPSINQKRVLTGVTYRLPVWSLRYKLGKGTFSKRGIRKPCPFSAKKSPRSPLWRIGSKRSCLGMKSEHGLNFSPAVHARGGFGPCAKSEVGAQCSSHPAGPAYRPQCHVSGNHLNQCFWKTSSIQQGRVPTAIVGLFCCRLRLHQFLRRRLWEFGRERSEWLFVSAISPVPNICRTQSHSPLPDLCEPLLIWFSYCFLHTHTHNEGFQGHDICFLDAFLCSCKHFHLSNVAPEGQRNDLGA